MQPTDPTAKQSRARLIRGYPLLDYLCCSFHKQTHKIQNNPQDNSKCFNIQPSLHTRDYYLTYNIKGKAVSKLLFCLFFSYMNSNNNWKWIRKYQNHIEIKYPNKKNIQWRRDLYNLSMSSDMLLVFLKGEK